MWVTKTKFERLTDDQRCSFTKAATQKRKTDKEYLKKLSETKLGNTNPSSKLNDKSVRYIRTLYKELLEEGCKKTQSQKELAMKFNVSRSTISDIVLRRTWKHID
ncbi:hypothetical protein GCM10011409_29830 [Lentibacillus populi]|uniref:Uncharacterized protein n=1 Tax=Lentibacillus populi TaxID=1827502 RepID=A0A9W5X6A0_9BACI|nr:hypothetical protein [Virgibacillus dakarensis]GGB50260.1 hypothetical protein GCM10011409_29830 [Lentibacillus populi]